MGWYLMEYMPIVDKILSRGKKKLDDLEVYLLNNKSLEIGIFKGELDKYFLSESGGLSIRGIKTNKMGYAYSEKLDESIIDSLIEEVYENSKYIETIDNDEIFTGSPRYKNINKFNGTFNEIPIVEKIEICKQLENYAYSLDKRVSIVQSCSYKEIEQERLLNNTKGIKLRDKDNFGFLYISVIVKDEEDTKTGTSYKVFKNPNMINYKEIAKDAVNKAILMIGASSIKSGSYTTVLKNTVFANLLEAFVSIFSADQAQRGLSLLNNKVGENIASGILTLVDDPFYKEGFSSIAFDDEGTSTKYKRVIDKGVLKTLLHSWKTAKMEGIESTGNASRSSYKSSLTISPSNFYIKRGNISFDNMIKRIEHGIYITNLAGLHSGLNTVSGDFSLSADGYEIVSGNISRPINQITIAGNFFELLKNIEDIGDDLKFVLPGTGYFGSPSITVKSLDRKSVV